MISLREECCSDETWVGSDTTMMDVSVIIVTYNSAGYIQACLDSVLGTTCRPGEIIVCDNASTDGTPELIRDRYASVILIESEVNLGFAAANNRAAEIATGRYLAFLNPDTVVEGEWLRPLIDVLQANPNVGAVTPMLVFDNAPDRINACGNNVHLSGIAYCREFGKPRYAGKPFEVGAISGAAFVLRKELFCSLGGLEEHLFLYYEDTDLSLRLQLKGLLCYAVPDSVVRHDYQNVFSPQKIYYLERNRLLSLLSLMTWRAFLLMLPSLVLVDALSWGYCLLRGPKALVAKASSWWAVVQHCRWLARRRRQLAVAPNNTRFLLGTLTYELEIQYVDARSSGMARVIDFASWLAGIPFLVWLASTRQSSPPINGGTD